MQNNLKLAEQSHESTKKIQTILEEMNNSVIEINKSIESTGAISEEQAASTQEISSNLEYIKNISEQLKVFVDRYK